jgi:hypothetical protein
MKNFTLLFLFLICTINVWGQSSTDFKLENANMIIDNAEPAGKGLLIYQGDSRRYGLIQVNQTAGMGGGTAHTLLLEAHNTYGAYYNQRILFKTANTDRLVIENNGYVGIGTTNPSARLHVNGEIVWGDHGARLSGDQGASIELRGSGRPFIDFSNDASTDFDARIILENDNTLHFSNANIGIGTNNPGSYKLAVEGKIGAREVNVTTAAWADFVFNEDYTLRPLAEVEQFIQQNGHLPDVPSEAEVLENGIDLGAMDAKLLQKIEELTLYMIEQNRLIQRQQQEIELLKEKIQ